MLTHRRVSEKENHLLNLPSSQAAPIKSIIHCFLTRNPLTDSVFTTPPNDISLNKRNQPTNQSTNDNRRCLTDLINPSYQTNALNQFHFEQPSFLSTDSVHYIIIIFISSYKLHVSTLEKEVLIMSYFMLIMKTNEIYIFLYYE